MNYKAGILAVLGLFFLTACHKKPDHMVDGEGSEMKYRQISQEEAKKIMNEEDNYVILDVRTREEYNSGHIPDAICIPVETITADTLRELPDKNQKILVYCRSGNRSKQAADRLAKAGYTNVYEFGGINTWDGEIVEEFPMDPIAFPVIQVGDRSFYFRFEDNSSAEALQEKLKNGLLEVQMHDYGHFEKVGTLPWTLPANDTQITTEPGDIILYQGNQLTIYYDENTWNFTRVGKIEDVTKEELLEVLGEGDVTVQIYLEWTE